MTVQNLEKIKVGSDADLVIIDMKRRDTIRAENLHTRAEFTPYESWEVQGLPMITLVRGQVIMREGEMVSRPGCGRFFAEKIRSEASFDKQELEGK